jgi:hypothetical protein
LAFEQEKQRNQDLQRQLVEKDSAAAGKMAKLEADLQRIQADSSSKDRDMAAKQAKVNTLEELKFQAEEREKQARALVHELVGLEPMELDGTDEPSQLDTKPCNRHWKICKYCHGNVSE